MRRSGGLSDSHRCQTPNPEHRARGRQRHTNSTRPGESPDVLIYRKSVIFAIAVFV